MANNNRAIEIHSSSDKETIVFVAAEEKEERQNNVDPWPHLKKYFKFIGEKNDKNVIYQCLAYRSKEDTNIFKEIDFCRFFHLFSN